MSMKVCIPSDGDDIDSKISDNFEAAKFFVIVDNENMSHVSVENDGKDVLSILLDYFIEAILTKDIEETTVDFFENEDIEVHRGAEGLVIDAVKDHKLGKL